MIKAVVSIIKVEINKEYHEGLRCVISSPTGRVESASPFSDIHCLDIPAKTKHIQVKFYHNEEFLASGNLIVPEGIDYCREVETTERFKSHLDLIESSGEPQIVAEFHLTFINPAVSSIEGQKATSPTTESKKKHTEEAHKTLIESSTKWVSKREKPTANSKESPKKVSTASKVSSGGKSSAKKEAFNESDLNNYLNKVVQSHLNQNSKAKEDLSHTSDCLALNEFNRITTSDLVNSSMLGDSIGRRSPAKERTDLDISHSPERLREQYSSKGKSPVRGGERPDMTSLLMDTETRRYVNDYKNQLELLRNIVHSLDQRLKEQDTKDREIRGLRTDVEKSNNSREELRKTLLETTSDLKEETDKFNKLVLDLEHHNKEVLRSLKEANNSNDDILTKLHAQEIRNTQLEAEIDELRAKTKSGLVYKHQFERATNDLIENERRHVDSMASFGKRILELEEGLDKLGRDKKELTDQNNRLQNALAELKVQLVQEKGNNNELSRELELLSNKLKLTQTSVELLKNVQDSREAIIQDLNKIKHQNSALTLQIESYENEAIQKAKENEFAERHHRDDNLRLNRKLAEADSFINELKTQNSKLKKDNIEIRNHAITLEQLLCVKEDVYSQLESSNTRLEERQRDCDSLRSQVLAGAKVSEANGTKMYELEKLIIYQKNIIADNEEVDRS
jgi:hypothetical protein